MTQPEPTNTEDATSAATPSDRAPVHEHLRDAYGRGIDYLRISVTDKCNLRCVYCMPASGVPYRPHDELLRIEEIARFVRLAAREGIRRVRLTGGEPLVARGIVDLIRQIKAIPEIEDIALTTNGALLPSLAPALKDAGLDRVNISLDTLDPAQFGRITRIGEIEGTLAGIDAALEYGFDPVKINCVVVRRLEQDVSGFARLSLDRPLHVRFIEYMPIGNDETRAHGALDPESATYDASLWGQSDVVAGPACYWRFPDAAGTVGFISAMSNHFCSQCNRLRLTADGTIRPCLFSDDEYSVREALRNGSDDDVLAIYRAALAHKPEEHGLIDGTARFMSQIGG